MLRHKYNRYVGIKNALLVIILISTSLLTISKASADQDISSLSRDYSYIQNYIDNSNLGNEERRVKVLLIADGIGGGNSLIDYSKIKGLYDAVKKIDIEPTDILDSKSLATYPGSLGTFETGILLGGSNGNTKISGILNNVDLYIANVFNGIGSSDQAYANALEYGESLNVNMIINGATLYDSVSNDRARKSCAVSKRLLLNGVPIIDSSSSDIFKNTFSLTDCSGVTSIGYLSENLKSNSRFPAREYKYVAIGENIFSLSNSSDLYPFAYSTANQWSAVIAGGIIAKAYSSSNITMIELMKNLEKGSILLEDGRHYLLNYKKLISEVQGGSHLSDSDLLKSIIDSGKITRVLSIKTDKESTEINIEPKLIKNNSLVEKFIIELYKIDNGKYIKKEYEMKQDEARKIINEKFESSSYIVIKSIYRDGSEEFSAPYSNYEVIKKEIDSDQEAIIKNFEASWVSSGIKVKSTTDSKLGSLQPRQVLVVNNETWEILYSSIVYTDDFIIPYSENSNERKIKLGVGVFLNQSEAKTALLPYINTSIVVTKVRSNNYLIKGSIDKESCNQECLKERSYLIVDGKKYSIRISPTAYNFYLYIDSKKAIKNVTIKNSHLRSVFSLYN